MAYTPNLRAPVLSGLLLWVAADAIEEADGTPISTWGDLSFNFSAFTQPIPSQQPLFRLNQANGLPAVVFDAVDDILRLTENPDKLRFDYQQPWTAVVVCSPSAPIMGLTNVEIPASSLRGVEFMVCQQTLFLTQLVTSTVPSVTMARAFV